MSTVPPVATVFHGRHPHLFLSSLRDRRWSHGRIGRKTVLATSGLSFAAEGPSCIFVGPIEAASQEMLEALYHQARDSYYSGRPLVVDDMFDRIELKLRLCGSKSVAKYPRCSLRRQSTYADAEDDPSQVLALASVWILLLAFGASAILVPIIYSIGLTYKEMFGTSVFLDGGRLHMECLTSVNSNMLFMGLGCLIGYPVASASVQALQGLLKNNLVALKGSCPNCGEEVFAFVKAEKSNQSAHSTECHVCQCDLEFRAKVEQSGLTLRRRWVCGRVYLVRRMA